MTHHVHTSASVSDSLSTSPALSGRLSDIHLADVLQLMCNQGRRGVIAIEGETSGRIHFDGARVVAARLQNRRGTHAVYAALALAEGTFSVTLDVVLPAPDVDAPTHALVMEGMRRLDECNRILEDLDATSMTFVAARGWNVPGVSRLFKRPITLHDAMTRSPVGTLETLEQVQAAVEAGALEALPRELGLVFAAHAPPSSRRERGSRSPSGAYRFVMPQIRR